MISTNFEITATTSVPQIDMRSRDTGIFVVATVSIIFLVFLYACILKPSSKE